jgi:arabinogalactan endo-1,4-beta-galactosidase
MVQVGNETNTEILVTLPVTEDTPIDWRRNAALLNAGLAGVLDAGRQTGRTPATMLHIAQPENVEPWFDDAIAAGVADFDLIGISYYPKWSSRDMHGLGKTVRRVRHKYGKEVIVVETAYPWTLQGNDAAGNLLGEDALIEAYPATLAGQNGFLQDLAQTVMSHGGSGVVYWEPAWVSSECSTRWGQGSHWENSTFFDYKDTSAHTGFDFLSHDYKLPVTVRFIANFAKASTDAPVYLWASFFDGQDFVVKMEQRAGEYVYPATLPAGHAFEYRYFAEPAMQVPLSAIEHATVSVPEVRETTGALRMDIRTALGVR